MGKHLSQSKWIKRSIVGFLVSPLIGSFFAALLFVVAHLLFDIGGGWLNSRYALGHLVMLTVWTYIFGLILGLIPAIILCWFARRMRWGRWWQISLIGIIIGMGWGMLLPHQLKLGFLYLCTATGFFSALTFWFIEVRGNPKYQKMDRPSEGMQS